MSTPSDQDDDGHEECNVRITRSKRSSISTRSTRQSTAADKKQLATIEKPTTKTTKKKETEPKTSVKTTTKITKLSKSKKQETEGEIDADNVHIYYQLNEKEMKEVNNAFDMNCSADGEELLCSADLKTAIRSLGFEPRADEIQKLLKKFSKNGKINRDSFHKIMAFKLGSSPGLKDNDSSDEISRVFNLLDLDKTGMITLDNLKSISKELNEEITDEELHEMIAEADIDGDFQINKQEFYNIMKKTSLY